MREVYEMIDTEVVLEAIVELVSNDPLLARHSSQDKTEQRTAS